MIEFRECFTFYDRKGTTHDAIFGCDGFELMMTKVFLSDSNKGSEYSTFIKLIYDQADLNKTVYLRANVLG